MIHFRSSFRSSDEFVRMDNEISSNTEDTIVTYAVASIEPIAEPSRGRRRPTTRPYQRKPYTCTICSKVFHGMSRIKRHLNTHAGVKPFPCEMCNSAFGEKHLLETHIMSVHERLRPYECEEEECGKAFATDAQLKEHRRSHTQKRIYPCRLPNCTDAFVYRRSRTAHEAWHTKPTIPLAPRPRCDLCDELFTRHEHLRAHKLKQHNVDVPPMRRRSTVEEDDLVWGCDRCTRRYKHRQSLGKHRNVIHGVYSFVPRKCHRDAEEEEEE